MQLDFPADFSFVSGDEIDGSLTKNGKGEIIRIALDVLKPERTFTAVIIGDRKHDIISGCDAGIYSIGITWGYGSRAELEEAGATWIAESTKSLSLACTMPPASKRSEGGS